MAWQHTRVSSKQSHVRERKLLGALALNVVIVVVQVVVGIAASSLGLLADAAHNLTDVAAIAVSLYALRVARRKATAAKSFGYHRATTLAAQANAASVLIVCVLIAVEAVRRLGDPAEVHGLPVIVVAAIAAVVNFAAAGLLHGDHTSDGHTSDGHASGGHASGGHHDDAPRDLNMHSALLHMVADGAVSVGVAIVGAVILVTGGWYWLDPLVSIVISVVIGVQGWQLLRAAADILLEGTPVGLDTAALVDTITHVDGVESVHDVHVWTLSTELRAMSAHIVVDGHPSLEQAQVVGANVRVAIGAAFGIGHATLELECEECAGAGTPCLDPSPK